jgi:hypothetical protein
MRQLVDRPWILPRVALGRVIDEIHVRVGDRRLLEILVDRRAALLIASLDLEGDLRPALMLPVDLLALENPRLVLLGVDRDLEVVRRRARAGARDDLHGLARGELGVHAGG